jgi:hypothetical protein
MIERIDLVIALFYLVTLIFVLRSTSALRIVAGQHDRTNYDNTQISNVASYKIVRFQTFYLPIAATVLKYSYIFLACSVTITLIFDQSSNFCVTILSARRSLYFYEVRVTRSAATSDCKIFVDCKN